MIGIAYTHPHPQLNRLAHLIVRVMLGLLWFTIPVQILLVALLSAPMMLFSAVLSAFLSLPLLMFLYATPPLRLADDALTICPPYGKPQRVPWAAIYEMRDYPLLPTPDQEIERRAWLGRKRYQPARGKLFLIRGLPWPYRALGIFVGVYPAPAIAITNRTHQHYDQLVQTIRHYSQLPDE